VSRHNQSDVYIWFRGTAALDGEAVRSADQHLSAEERARRDRLHFDADRRDFTIAHDLLRRALSMYEDVPPTDWRFATDNYGKPSIDSNNPQLRALSFSLSHTRGCVACAITSSAPLGVDVQRTDQLQCVEEIADRYFSEKEAAWLRQCSGELRNIRFAELWTLKEAFLKAVGVGLSGSLANISFRFEEHARIEVSGPSAFDPLEWYFALFEPVYDVRLGIAIRNMVRPRFFLRQDEGHGPILRPFRVSASADHNT
jgi:phosphopantetheinyl transferase